MQIHLHGSPERVLAPYQATGRVCRRSVQCVCCDVSSRMGWLDTLTSEIHIAKADLELQTGSK